MLPKPGRPARNATQMEAARDKIARHALTLFRQEGFASVSIRRLAKEVGCAPMTIYAHFGGKTDILQYLWADVLKDVFEEIQTGLDKTEAPQDRLAAAAKAFVRYWLNNADHFRLVFMSGGVSRTDVATFMKDPQTRQYFKLISDLVKAAAPDQADVKTRADTLVSGLIGIALCLNTIVDYPWSAADAMTETLLACVATLDHTGMFAQDVALGRVTPKACFQHDDHPVRIDPQADGPVGEECEGSVAPDGAA